MGVTVVSTRVVRIDKRISTKAGRWIVLNLSFDANFPDRETKKHPPPKN